MTDISSDGGITRSRERRAAAERREYWAYFTLIFLATLPLAFLTWGLTALRQFRLPERGPIARAWSQAGIITPMLFAA